MKLSRIRIRDFQKHQNLVLKVDPSVTVISGETDKGKSAVIRAVRWVCLNKPDGKSFIRRGRKKTSVTLEFGDVGIVSRSKNGRNTYKLNTPKLSRKYHAFRRDIPDTIKAFLNLSDLNFQSQHDSPFWLSDSNAEVSRKLNEIVDLGIIDSTLAELGHRLREQRVRLKVHKEAIEQHREEVRKLRKVKKVDEDLQHLEQLSSSSQNVSNQIETLGLLIHDLERESRTSKKARTFVKEALPLLSLTRTGEELNRHVVVLDQCIKTLVEDSSKSTIPKECFEDLEELQQMEALRQDKESSGNDLRALIEYVATTLIDSEKAKVEARKAEKEFHKKVKGQTCPLCGNKL